VQRAVSPPREKPDAHPGLVALATGLATRAADGSVVFSRLADAQVTPEPSPSPPITPAVASASASAAPAPAARPGATGPELDELASRLYDRIRFRLRSELHLDRERAGLVTNI
jgi:hypothetical protein